MSQYIIWNPKGQRPPTVVFNSEAEARAEAERLTEKTREGEFCVCQLVSEARDEIERLRAALKGQNDDNGKLSDWNAALEAELRGWRAGAEPPQLLALFDLNHQDFGQHRMLDISYDAQALVLRKFPETQPGEWNVDEGDPTMWFSPCGRYGIAPAYIVPKVEAQL